MGNCAHLFCSRVSGSPTTRHQDILACGTLTLISSTARLAWNIDFLSLVTDGVVTGAGGRRGAFEQWHFQEAHT